MLTESDFAHTGGGPQVALLLLALVSDHRLCGVYEECLEEEIWKMEFGFERN